MKKIVFSLATLVFTTIAFSQNCFKVSTPAGFSGPDVNGKFTLTFNYATIGTKSLNTVVKCGSTVILDDCFKTHGSGTKVFTNLMCTGGMADLSATFTPYTGECGAAQCGPTQILPPGGGPLLPIKLSSFSAVRSKQAVSLNWITEFEIDSREFIVERADGTEFRSVGSIQSSGNSSTQKSYSFSDKNENIGLTYYRLKNVDLDNKFTYSEIKTVKGVGAVNDISVFPNPAHSNSKISVVGITANSSIQLLDFSGKILKSINSNTINSLDLTGIKNGTYLIRIIDKTTNETVNKTLTVNN